MAKACGDPRYTAKPEASTERLPVCRASKYATPTCRGMEIPNIETADGRVYRCLMSERKIRGVYENE